MALITYEDKISLNYKPEIAEKNKVTDTNMNEIKNVVNLNYNEFQNSTLAEVIVGLPSQTYNITQVYSHYDKTLNPNTTIHINNDNNKYFTVTEQEITIGADVRYVEIGFTLNVYRGVTNQFPVVWIYKNSIADANVLFYGGANMVDWGRTNIIFVPKIFEVQEGDTIFVKFGASSTGTWEVSGDVERSYMTLKKVG